MKNIKTLDTWKEIMQQPDVWQQAFVLIKESQAKIKAFMEAFELNDYKIIFTGAGTSEFVGSCLAPVLMERGFDVYSLATTDLVSNIKGYLHPHDRVVLVSFARSGNSPESVATFKKVEAFVADVRHIVITCNVDGQLVALANQHKSALTILLPPQTNDKSFAMTSSFTTMGLAAYLLFQVDCLDKIQPQLKTLIHAVNEFQKSGFETINQIALNAGNRVVYLGGGALKAFAQESHLKVLELTAGETLAFFNSPLGFRHGPKSVVNAQTTIFMYMNQNAYKRKYDQDLLDELLSQNQHGQLVVVDCKKDNESSVGIVNIKFDVNELDEFLIGLAYINVAQLFALASALALGKNPDNPWPSGFVNRVVQGVKIH